MRIAFTGLLLRVPTAAFRFAYGLLFVASQLAPDAVRYLSVCSSFVMVSNHDLDTITEGCWLWYAVSEVQTNEMGIDS